MDQFDHLGMVVGLGDSLIGSDRSWDSIRCRTTIFAGKVVPTTFVGRDVVRCLVPISLLSTSLMI